MSDAITHYRQLRELTTDELAYVLLMLDDLVAIAYVLDTTPAVLLSHIPIDMPEPEGPFATGSRVTSTQPSFVPGSRGGPGSAASRGCAGGKSGPAASGSGRHITRSSCRERTQSCVNSATWQSEK